MQCLRSWVANSRVNLLTVVVVEFWDPLKIRSQFEIEGILSNKEVRMALNIKMHSWKFWGGYSCFKMLCYFLLHSKRRKLYVYVQSLFFGFPPIFVTTEYWVPHAMQLVHISYLVYIYSINCASIVNWETEIDIYTHGTLKRCHIWK